MSEAPRAFRVEQFRDYMSFERGLSERTVSAYLGDLGRLLAFCRAEGVATPEAVSPELIRSWIYILRDQGLAPPSIRRARSAARTYFAFLLAEGVLAADPTEHIQAPRAGRKL